MPPLKTKFTTKEICEAAAIEADETLPAPDAYLKKLFVDGLHPEAVRFLSQAQEPRECIEWGAQALDVLDRPQPTPEQKAAFQQVQTWLADPGEAQRRAAKDRAEETGLETPEGTLAMGVFFSGGSIAPPSAPEVPPPPTTCQKFVAGAVILAVVSDQPQRAAERFQSVLALRQPEIASEIPRK